MTPKQASELAARLLTLAEVFGVTVSEARMGLYIEALRDLPFPQLVEGLNAAARASKFFPKPSELRELALGSTEDAAELAWLSFRQAMGRFGYMASVAVHDAALGEAIIALFGGWEAACLAELSPEMWASKRKEFGRIYQALKQRKLTGVRYLVGATERQNGGRPDWLVYAPLGRIGADGALRALSQPEAAAERLALTNASQGLLEART